MGLVSHGSVAILRTADGGTEIQWFNHSGVVGKDPEDYAETAK